MLDDSERSFWRTFVRSVRDNALGESVIQVLRVGGMVLLARMLRAEDFGLLRVLLAATAFVTIICELGIPEALIQLPGLGPNHETTAFWLTIPLAGLCTAALYFGAPEIARLMRMPDLVFALRLMCLPLFLGGSSTVPTAMLRRAMNFGALVAADVLAEAAFFAAAFLLLWTGLLQYSLAGALAARFAVRALAIWSASGGVSVGLPRMDDLREFWRFSLAILAGRVMATASNNIDYLLVGRLLGSAQLGFYSMAWDLLRFVPDRLHNVAGRVAIPAFCRLQDDDRRLGAAYRDLTGYLARVEMPLLACAAVAAPELVSSIYGPRWLPTAAALRILALGIGLYGLRSPLVAVYYSKDHPSLATYVDGLRTLLVGVAAFSLAGGRLAGVSAGVGTAEAFVTFVGVYLACRLIALNITGFYAACVPGLRLTLLCFALAGAGRKLGLLAGLHGALLLATAGLPSAIAYCWFLADDVVRSTNQLSAEDRMSQPNADPEPVERTVARPQ